MEIIEVLREVRKLVVETIGPETLRIDPLPTGTFLYCGHSASDIAMSAKLHSPIQGLTEPIAFGEPKILSLVFGSKEYEGSDAKVTFVDYSTGRYFRVSNAAGSVAQLKVLGGSTLVNFAKKVNAQDIRTQLVMPVNALWKQQFEYWSKFVEGGASKNSASFFVRQGQGLCCLIGDYNFEHHMWSCEPGQASGFVSAVSFRCDSMIKVLKLFPLVRRMSISVSTDSLVVVKADGFNADYTFVLPGEVPHWYWATRLPIYELDDPRSVMQQRQDES